MNLEQHSALWKCHTMCKRDSVYTAQQNGIFEVRPVTSLIACLKKQTLIQLGKPR